MRYNLPGASKRVKIETKKPVEDTRDSNRDVWKCDVRFGQLHLGAAILSSWRHGQEEASEAAAAAPL